MPPCINDPSKRYRGDEPSPRGRGFTARREARGTFKVGRDGTHWIVAARQNGVRYWQKIHQIGGTYDLQDPINMIGRIDERVSSVLRVPVGRAANVSESETNPVFPLGEMDSKVPNRYNKSTVPLRSALKRR